MTYNANGVVLTQTFNGQTTSFVYDTMGCIVTVGNSADTLTYTYAPETGRVASSAWNTATENTAYTYDQYKRLTGIAVNNTSVYGYTLNAKNQRTGATLPDGKTWNYSYDALGQLDLAQKFTSDSSLLGTYIWNGENRMIRAENSTAGVKMEFDYDYMGRRIFKKVYHGKILSRYLTFVYDSYKLIEERDALDSTAAVRKFV